MTTATAQTTADDLGLNFELTPEQKEFADHFRKFCAKEIGPYSHEFEQAGQVPKEIFKKMAQSGFTGLLFDQGIGGQGASIFEATLAQEILAEYCGSTFFSVGASIGLFGKGIDKFGSQAQRQKYLPEIIAGTKVGCLGVTEPGAGSDVSRLTTTAKENSDGYILNGQKTYITNAPIADFGLILARLTTESGREMGLTHFLVEMNREGVSQGRPMKKMGLHGSPTGEIFLDNVHIPKENLVGGSGKGFRQTMEVFNFERLSLAAWSCGVMQACLDESKSFAKNRKAFGKAIAKHQAVAFMLADIVTYLESARLLMYATAWKMDQVINAGGKISSLTEDAALVKLLASQHARHVTNLAVQIHGGAGYIEEYRVCRLYRDIKLAEIGGGTSEIQEGIIARAQEKKY